MSTPQQDRRSLVARLAAIVRRRELLVALTHREVQVRYKQALLGMAWAVFLPITLMLVFTAITWVFLKYRPVYRDLGGAGRLANCSRSRRSARRWRSSPSRWSSWPG